jgi:peptide/nickel transport system permease protein
MFPFFLGSWETLSFLTHEKEEKGGQNEERSFVFLPPIIVYATLAMGTAVLQAVALGFLGLGAQPPTPEWSAMLSEGRQYIQLAPHVAGFPGVAIFTPVLGFNVFGDGLRDVFDPSLR